MTHHEKARLRQIAKFARELALSADLLLAYGEERIDQVGGAGYFSLIQDARNIGDLLADAGMTIIKRGTT